MKKLSSFTLVFIGLCLSLSAGAQVDNGGAKNSDIHQNSHEKEGASILYQTWKNNQTLDNDPFRRIKNGYTGDYDEGIVILRDGELSDDYASSVEAMDELTHSDIEKRKLMQKESWENAYLLSKIEGERNVDREIFDAEIASAREDRNTAAISHYENMKLLLSSHSITASTTISVVNNQTNENKYNASVNIIELMNNDATNNKVSLVGLFADNLERAADANAQAQTTLDITNEFSTEKLSEPPTPVNPGDGPDDDLPYYPPPNMCYGETSRGVWEFYLCPDTPITAP